MGSWHVFLFVFYLQNKYKEAGKKEVNRSLYSLLPHTMETQHAKEAAELLSEVTWCFLLLLSEKTVNIRDQNLTVVWIQLCFEKHTETSSVVQIQSLPHTSSSAVWCYFITDQVQGEWEEGDVQLHLLHSARHFRHQLRQRDDWSAERGKKKNLRYPSVKVLNRQNLKSTSIHMIIRNIS